MSSNSTLRKILMPPIVFLFLYVLFPFFLFSIGKGKLNDDELTTIYCFHFGVLIGTWILLIIWNFFREKENISLRILAISIIYLSVFPQIFFKIYKEDKSAYHYEPLFIDFLEKENISQLEMESLLSTSREYYKVIEKESLQLKPPRDKDTVIFINDTIAILSKKTLSASWRNARYTLFKFL